MTPSSKEVREALGEAVALEADDGGRRFPTREQIARWRALYDSLLTAEAEANVLAIRPWDAPGFDACVKAERERLSQMEDEGQAETCKPQDAANARQGQCVASTPISPMQVQHAIAAWNALPDGHSVEDRMKAALETLSDRRSPASVWINPPVHSHAEPLGELTITATASHSPSALTEAGRTPKDRAIEFAEYLAKAAERYMAFTPDNPDEEGDAYRALRSAIYEFRKRIVNVSALTDALDALVIHADAYLAGECTKAEFSEAVDRSRKLLASALSPQGRGVG